MKIPIKELKKEDLHDKNKELPGRIDHYFHYLKAQGKQVKIAVLCELIEQWDFDYEMEKDLNRFRN